MDSVVVDTGGNDTHSDVEDELIDVGERCMAPNTCVEGAACVGKPDSPEFLCMRVCAEAGRVCEDGSFCTSRLNAPPVCYIGGTLTEGETCETNLHCEPGNLCFGRDGERYCDGACHPLDNTCPNGEFCDSTGDKGPCRSMVGAECATSADCSEELECTAEQDAPLDGTFPSGLCTVVACGSDEDCPYDSRCRTAPGTETPICLQSCELEADCRFNQDYTCLASVECNDTSGGEACGQFLDSASLCVPDAMLDTF